MICRHLKVCILLAFAAVLCGGRAFGDTRFWCPECKENIECERWGSHVYDKHKDNMRIRPSVRCPYCPEELPLGKVTFRTVLEWRCHKSKYHSEQSSLYHCLFSCKLCKEAVAPEEWSIHLWFMHLYGISDMYDAMDMAGLCEIYDISVLAESGVHWCSCETCSQTSYSYDWAGHAKVHCYMGNADEAIFCCGTCGMLMPCNDFEAHVEKAKSYKFFCKKCKCDVPKILHMKHLGEKHSVVLDPLRLCRICKGKVDGADWNEHIGLLHLKTEELRFNCPKYGAKGVFLKSHVAEKHASECLYCSATVKDEGDRKKHMEEKHKVWCPVCEQQIFDVIPDIHCLAKHNEVFCPVDSCKKQCINGTVFRHLYQKHGDYWRECKLCRILVVSRDLASHCGDDFHKKSGYYCKLCNDYFIDPIKQDGAFLLKHMCNEHGCPPSCGFDKNLEFKHVLSCRNYVGAWRCPVCEEKCRCEDIAIHNTTVHRCSKKCHIDTECKSLKWIHDESCKYKDDPNLAPFLCPICRVEFGNVWHMKNTHGCNRKCGMRGYEFAHAEDCRYFNLSYPCPLCFKSECTEEHMCKEHECLSDECVMWHYMGKAVWRHASECRNYDAEKEKTLNEKLGDDFGANYEEYEDGEYEDGEYE